MNRIILMIAALVAASEARAQDPSALVGTWEGFLKPAPIIEVRVVLRVEARPGGGLKATAETPDSPTMKPVEFDSVTLKDGSASFVSKAAGREYVAKLEPTGGLVGDWKKEGTSTPLAMAKLDGPAAAWEVWEGSIEVGPGIKLRLAFHVGKGKDGSPMASMDSPDQGAYSFKVDEVARDAGSLKLVLKAIGGEFVGKTEPGGESAVGTWKQGPMSMALTLKKVERASLVNRPQEPKPPFPYRAEDVSYPSQAEGVTIAGTLTIPPGPGPFPAALLITGSGAQDRDETLLGHKPFWVIADDLARRGVAVLRVDDRGTGRSTGDFSKATTFDFADDAQAGFAYLKGRKEVDPARVGLIGHSEGGLIAPIVASRTPEVGFIVLLAGPGLPGDQILEAQQALILKATGAKDEDIAKATASIRPMVAAVKAAKDTKAAEEKLKAIRDEQLAAMPEAERKALAASDPNGAALSRLTTPWMRAFLTFDPRPTLARVRCPVLAINGENDLQVPCRDNLEAISRALASGGNARGTTIALPKLNHLFQTSVTGAPSEYNTIEETVSPSALKAIGDWIVGLPASK